MNKHSLMTFTTDFYITPLKQMTIFTNIQTKTSQTAITVEQKKTTYICSRNVQEYKKFGNIN